MPNKTLDNIIDAGSNALTEMESKMRLMETQIAQNTGLIAKVRAAKPGKRQSLSEAKAWLNQLSAS